MAGTPKLEVDQHGACHLSHDKGRLKEEAWLPIGDSDMPYPIHLHQVGDRPEDISSYEVWSLPGDNAKTDPLRRGLFINSYYVDYFYSQISEKPESFRADLAKISAELGKVDGKAPSDDETYMALARQKAMLRVMGEAYRNMPAPSALPAFAQLLRLYEKHEGLPVALIVGPPGIGKTTLANIVGNVMDPRGPIYFDCGGKDMTQLIDRLEFKESYNKGVRTKLDKFLEEDPIHYSEKTLEALEWLKTNNLARFSKGKYTVQWDAIPAQFDMGGENLKEISENAGNQTKWKDIAGHLRTIVESEKLGASVSDDFPFEIADGPLLDAYNEDRVLVLDELNRYRRDSIEGFRNIFLFLTNPRQATYQYTRKNGTVVTFERDKVVHSRAFSILATGNDNTNTESTARDFDASLKERFERVLIPEANKVDYAHAFCREITNLPIITLAMMYGVNLQHPDRDPKLAKEFGLFLRELYDLGKSEDEIAYDPKRHLKLEMIKNWQGALKASQAVANAYYDTWYLFNDPQKALAASADQNDVVEELDNPRGYKTNVGPGMRLMLKHIRDAMDGNVVATIPPKSDLTPNVAAFSRIPSRRPRVSAEHAYQNMGDSFSLVAENFLRTNMQLLGKQKLWARLRRTFEENGLLEPEVSIAARTGAPLQLREMLSGDPIGNMPDTDHAQLLNLIEQHLREKHGIPADQELGVTGQEVTKALGELLALERANKIVLNPHPRANLVPLISDDRTALDPHTHGHRDFVKSGFVVDSVRNPWSGEPSVYDNRAGLDYIDHDQLVLSLVAPKFREFTQSAVYTGAISASGIVPETGQPPAIEMAQNKFQFPTDQQNTAMAQLGITTVVTGKPGSKDTEPVHIISRTHPDSTVIVGGHASKAVRNYLRSIQLANRGKDEADRLHIYYVDRYDSHAEEKLEELLKFVTESKGESREQHATRLQQVREAFLIRNHPTKEAEDRKITDLKKLMINPKLSECELPNFAVNAELKEVIQMVNATPPDLGNQPQAMGGRA